MCSNCNRDHHVLICPNEKSEQKLHKAQEDEEDDDHESEDEDYYQNGDLFDENQQFHFNQGPEYDDGDDFQDDYHSDDTREEEKDRDESALEERVDRTMFAKNLNDDIIQGDDQWKRVETYKTNPKGDGMKKSNPNDEGLKPIKIDGSNTIHIEKTCIEKQLMEDPSNTLEKVSFLEKTTY